MPLCSPATRAAAARGRGGGVAESILSGGVGRTDADFHFDPRPEAIQNRNQPIHGEAAQVGVSKPREVRRGHAGAFVRGAHAEAFAIEREDDLGRQNRLELLRVGILIREIPEWVGVSRAPMLSFLTTHVKNGRVRDRSGITLY